MVQQPVLSFVAVTLLVIGLVGNGFEMRKIRISTTRDEELASKKGFLNKKKSQVAHPDSNSHHIVSHKRYLYLIYIDQL